MKKILIIKHGSLGDIISSTSAMNDIRNHYNQDKIYLLTSKKYFNFFLGSSLVDDLLIDNRDGIISIIKIINKILKLKCDVIIDLQNSERTSLYAIIIRFFSKMVINGTGFFSTHRYKCAHSKIPSVINGLSNQIEILGIKTSRKPFLNWLENNKFNFDNISNKNYIIINPGCSLKNKHKRWSSEKYAKICTYLISKKILPIIIGSEEDRETIELIELHEKKILNLLNKSSLDIIYQLAKKSIGAISNDTGPAHLIAATECKIHLILSGFSNVDTVTPQGNNVSFTQKKYIDNISVEEITKKIQVIFNL